MQRNSAAPVGGKPAGKSGRPPSQRQLRVGEVIRHAIAEILQRGEVHDPVFEGKVVTVPEVRMAPDLKCATVYLMPLGGQGAHEVVEAFDRNKKFLRGEISRRVNLRNAPELRFRVDESFDAGSRIDQLLRSPEVTRDIPADDTAAANGANGSAEPHSANGTNGKDDPAAS